MKLGVYVAVIVLVLILALAASYAWYRRRGQSGRRKSGLVPGRGPRFMTINTPATPAIREAVGDLTAALERIIGVGVGFEAAAAPWVKLPVASAPSICLVNNARESAAVVVRALGRAKKAIDGSPPTYETYFALYRGLSLADKAFLDAAETYVNAGRQAHQIVATETTLTGTMEVVTPEAVGLTGELAELGVYLLEMGRLTREVVVAVHRLGAALDLE